MERIAAFRFEWPKACHGSVLPLVAGLFVIVEALGRRRDRNAWGSDTDCKLRLQRRLAGWQKQRRHLWWRCFRNALRILTCCVDERRCHSSRRSTTSIVAHAMLIGVDLGPNLSVTGSLATILRLIALRREKVEITAREFFRIGVIAMPVALIA